MKRFMMVVLLAACTKQPAIEPSHPEPTTPEEKGSARRLSAKECEQLADRAMEVDPETERLDVVEGCLAEGKQAHAECAQAATTPDEIRACW
jgi:hypothetical protein